MFKPKNKGLFEMEHHNGGDTDGKSMGYVVNTAFRFGSCVRIVFDETAKTIRQHGRR